MSVYIEKHNSEVGMTLVELMIAMVIGLILLGGVYVVFISSRTTYSLNEQVSRVQENGRFAIEVLTRDIRMAGYRGCGGDSVTIENFLVDQSYAYDFASSLRGYEAQGGGTWLPTLPTGTNTVSASSPLAGNDILVVRTLTDGNVVITTTATPTATTFYVPSGSDGIAVGDTLMVTDCSNPKAAVFQVTSAVDSGGYDNLVHDVSATTNIAHSLDYGEGAELAKLSTVTYFIRNVDAGGNTIEPTLYRRVGSKLPEQLVEGIESMQILYGEDTNNDRSVNGYVAANAVTDWANVVSVRIGLLARSPKEMAKGEIDTTSYDVNGTSFTAPGDRRLRLVMNTTVALRNHLK